MYYVNSQRYIAPCGQTVGAEVTVPSQDECIAIYGQQSPASVKSVVSQCVQWESPTPRRRAFCAKARRRRRRFLWPNRGARLLGKKKRVSVVWAKSCVVPCVMYFCTLNTRQTVVGLGIWSWESPLPGSIWSAMILCEQSFESCPECAFRKSLAMLAVTAHNAACEARYGARRDAIGGSMTCDTVTNSFGLTGRDVSVSDAASSSLPFSFRFWWFAGTQSPTIVGRNCRATTETPLTSLSIRDQSSGFVRHAAYLLWSSRGGSLLTDFFPSDFFPFLVSFVSGVSAFEPSFSPFVSPVSSPPNSFPHRVGMHPTLAMTIAGGPCVKSTFSRHRATAASSPRSTFSTEHWSPAHSFQCWLRSEVTRSALGVAAATVSLQSGYSRSAARSARPMPCPTSARTTVLAHCPPVVVLWGGRASPKAWFAGAKPSPHGTKDEDTRETRRREATRTTARSARSAMVRVCFETHLAGGVGRTDVLLSSSLLKKTAESAISIFTS